MRWVLLFAFVFSLSGCLKTRSELKGGTSANMQTDSQGRFVTGDMNPQQRAQIDSRFFEINKDFRDLYGKIEVLEKRLDDASTAPEEPKPQATGDQMAKLEQMKKRVATLEEALLALDKKINGLSSGKSKSAKKVAKPKGPFGWGELHYSNGEFEKAISSYDKYRRKFPRGRRYAQATLKMGLSFEKLRMKQDAKAFYKEVIQRYPKTRVAIRAEKNLKRL